MNVDRREGFNIGNEMSMLPYNQDFPSTYYPPLSSSNFMINPQLNNMVERYQIDDQYL